MTSYVANPYIGKQASNALALSQEMAIDAQLETLPQHLTPESLLAYCSSRLNSLDEQINHSFADQKSRNQAVRDAAQLMVVCNRFQGHYGSKEILTGGNGMSPESVQQGHADMANDIAKIYATTTDAQVRAQCEAYFHDVTGQDIHAFVSLDGKQVTTIKQDDIKAWANADQIPSCAPEKWAGMIGGTKDVQDSLSKSSELDMISLQSLVAQRQLAVQLTTQMMQAINEGPKQAAGNIGR